MAAKASKPPMPRAGVGRSRSSNDREESVYSMAALGANAGAAPKVRVYNIVPEAPPTPGANGPAPQAPPAKFRSGSAGDSSQIESIINPVRGLRDAQQRAGIVPVNHAKANAMAVREASQMNALRKANEEQGGSSKGLKLPPVRSTSAPSRQQQLQRRPSSQGSIAGRDFIAENRMGAAAPLRAPRADKQEPNYMQKKDFGQVPNYLLERKMQMAADVEAQQRAKEAALIPPGMRLLPEDERLETLAILAKNREEVERAIQHLPLRIETLSAIRRKEDLERRLKEIEEAQKIFSRPKVLVHL